MLKSLKKYLKSVGIQLDLNSIPQQTDMMLFSIDRLLYFHSIHLHLQKRVNKYLESNDWTELKKEIEEVGNNKTLVYNYIRAFFLLFVIELAKDLELKENSIYKTIIDGKVMIRPYQRHQYSKIISVTKISELIMHFRDAMGHNQTLGISDFARFPKSTKLNSTNHLKYLVDDKKREQFSFMIGEGVLNYNELELLIQTVLIVGYKNHPLFKHG